MKRIYPAIFHVESSGGYWVSFPDIEGCFSQGDTWEDAFKGAKEALTLYLDGISVYPKASNIEDLQLGNDERVMLIED